MKKNDIISITVTGMSSKGEGIGKADAFPFFVKDTAVGDEVQVRILKLKKNYGYARLEKIIKPSDERTDPLCPLSKKCGGCQLQHISHGAQLKYKEKKVEDALAKIGGFDRSLIEKTKEPVEGADEGGEFRYRNKMEIPVSKDKEGGIIFGFYAGRTHDIIPMKECYLGKENVKKILGKIKEHMEENNIAPYDEKTLKGTVRHVQVREGENTGEVMVCLVINGDKIPHEEEFVKKLTQADGRIKTVLLNINKKKTNVILGSKERILYGDGYISERMGDLSFRISSRSFFQVNTKQAEKIYKKAVEFAALEGTENVYDLYCGTGTISLFFAGGCKKVRGVEVVSSAVADAKKNVLVNGVQNVEFVEGKAEDMDLSKADVVILDPPRKGADGKLLGALLKENPKKIVYVSCDPATLARDLRVLCEGGYELKKWKAFDQFAQTVHVETVVLLGWKGEKQDYMYFDYEADHHIPRDGKASYREIKEWILKEYGLKVSSLYIAQIKSKCGMDKRENYNLSKEDGKKAPECPKEKEDAIMAAFKHFGMI